MQIKCKSCEIDITVPDNKQSKVKALREHLITCSLWGCKKCVTKIKSILNKPKNKTMSDEVWDRR